MADKLDPPSRCVRCRKKGGHRVSVKVNTSPRTDKHGQPFIGAVECCCYCAVKGEKEMWAWAEEVLAA